MRRVLITLTAASALLLSGTGTASAVSARDFAGVRTSACVTLLPQLHISQWGGPYTVVWRRCP